MSLQSIVRIEHVSSRGSAILKLHRIFIQRGESGSSTAKSAATKMDQRSGASWSSCLIHHVLDLIVLRDRGSNPRGGNKMYVLIYANLAILATPVCVIGHLVYVLDPRWLSNLLDKLDISF